MRSKAFVEEYVPVNGITMYLCHYPQREKPVLLYLHGGPGSTNALLSHLYAGGLRNVCTLVDWDQRGTGKTYLKHPQSAPELETMLEDLAGVVAHLKARYGVGRVALLGHSWGSVLGSLYALRHPEDLLCYIGVGQLVDMRENEEAGYAELCRRIAQGGSRAHARSLAEIGAYPGEDMLEALRSKLPAVRKLQRKYGLAFRFTPSLVRHIVGSPLFRLSDFGALRGGEALSASLDDTLAQYDLRAFGAEYGVPIYYVLGGKDWQTPFPIAAAYLETVTAPDKRLYMIADAGHNLPCDCPARFAEAIADILSRLPDAPGYSS